MKFQVMRLDEDPEAPQRRRKCAVGNDAAKKRFCARGPEYPFQVACQSEVRYSLSCRQCSRGNSNI